ncbi:tripartite tricarboxylate transporter substrate binding protein [Roseomonas sp. HJA6]|uniref:Tripartite tricarboxylate transporter substrate binding protein n=1 Tax=Roseomonas alba TaxID=2846776 RepID=A0ABS7A849_9PROT|nr:tripartite tricarboxylate transporter substrate binding protein [Neoroseomonas alba]MBW6398348.1 tripartite tricarboxylate transporter substrate binding protein [Neoroseomonas alba]
MTHGSGRRGLLLAAPAVLAAGSARAQAWPNRPVRIVVGFAAGGANDIMARLLAQKLSERLPGSAFVVENRPGGSTLVAAELVARATPDGTTFFYTSPSTLISSLVNRSAAIEAVQSLVPVTLAQSSPLALICRPDFPARTVPEFLALAREKQGRMTVSHPGTGAINHLALILLMRQTGIELTPVPYTGNQPSITALIRGEVDVAHDGLFTPRSQLEAGTLRAIAVTSAERSPIYPDVPTFGETLTGYEVGFWGGMLAPRGTPDPILDRMNQELDAILRQPEVIERVRGFGAEPVGGNRDRFAQALTGDWAKWGAVVRENNIRAD